MTAIAYFKAGADVAITAAVTAALAVSINAQTGTTYTFVLGDAGDVITGNNASAQTFTVPTNASVAFPVGSSIEIVQLGAGQVTLAPASGVTLNSRGGALKTAGQYAVVGIQKIATNTWIALGDLST